jgi:hypothetical protein
MKEINRDDAKRKALVEDYEDIYRHLCTMQEEKQIDEEYLYNLVELMNRLNGVVAKDANNVKGEVVNMAQNNMTTQQIASIAGLSLDEVEEIIRIRTNDRL